MEESKLRSLMSGCLEALCKRNDTPKNKASVAIFLVCKHCFCHSNVPAETFNLGLLHYFILQKTQLPFVPFVDPVLKIYIYCESSGRSRGGACALPLIVTLNCCTKD